MFRKVPRYSQGTSFFLCHFIPKGKMHYIPNDTSSNIQLHPLMHFIPGTVHLGITVPKALFGKGPYLDLSIA